MRALKVINKTIKSIQKVIGNQCREAKIGVIVYTFCLFVLFKKLSFVYAGAG